MAEIHQIIHVDMDAFYASVEQRDNPELAGKPIVVGGSVKSRGVVAAASYEARRFGIHSAMPMSRAVKLCPNLVVLPVRMERYKKISENIRVIFEKCTPIVESIQLRKRTVEQLQIIVGNFAKQLLEFANGIDRSEVVSYKTPKSISTEQTFEMDSDDKNFLLGVLLSEVETVAARLRQNNIKAKTFTIKFRYGNFRSITRSKTIPDADNSTAVLWKVFEQWYLKERGPLRLIGFEASHFETKDTGQMLLFGEEKNYKQKMLDEVVDKIRKRYGDNSLKRKY